MSAQGTVRPLPPINYVPVITEYSWWTSKSGLRKFVIVRIHWSFKDLNAPYRTGVEFLELDKTEPVIKTWDAFVKLVEAGEMVKLI
jgi:hypothetical protein